MSSLYKVPLTTITEINEHPNADRLELARVYGFDVIIGKGSFNVGDSVIYIPIDSILPPELELHLFPEGSKIKLTKNRVRQIKIRSIVSQGMLISPDAINIVYGFTPTKIESDHAELLKVTKYEPPTRGNGTTGPVRKRKPLQNVNFHKYNGLTNIKWSPLLFNREIVVYQEKIHGSNTRAGMLPFEAHSLWERIKGFFGLNPEYEFCYGSNNVQLQKRKDKTGFYGEDVYGKVFREINAESKLLNGETIFGELYGEGIQKNYDYGVKGKHKFVLFDVKVLNEDGTQTWLNPDEVKRYAEERGFDMVPELYRGPFIDLEHARDHTVGNSVMAPSQKVMEGLVVKSVENYCGVDGNKRALKMLSEAYLGNKSNTDFH